MHLPIKLDSYLYINHLLLSMCLQLAADGQANEDKKCQHFQPGDFLVMNLVGS